MYKLCKTEQSAARQRELEHGLVAVMNTMRYEDITVSDLCQKMNIPRKSFYRYFSSKDGALHALIDHTLMEYESAAFYPQGRHRSLQGDLEGFFLYWVQHKPLLDALERSSLSGILIERSIGYSVSEGVFPGRFMPDELAHMRQHVVMFGVCGLMTMMLQWHHRKYRESAADMARVAARLLTQPLFPDVDKMM
jgi:AcrR family transcriptional regulator